MSKLGRIIREAKRGNQINKVKNTKLIIVNTYKNHNRLIEKSLHIQLKKIRVCENCKKTFPYQLEIHHKIPIRLGGNNSRANLMVVCKSCHEKIDGKVGDP